MLARLVAAAGASLVLLGAQASSESVRKAKPAPVQPAAAPVALGDEELLLSTQVSVGNIPCELGQSVTLRADADAPGYFHLQLKNQRFHLRPVMSATGALRLEDQARGAVWIQLANKSMLMDQKQGRRLADECMSPLQAAYAEHLRHNPAPNLLDVAQKSR
ncbi:hypothetical protein C6P61_12065 [Malikia spinosa]|uniref:Uncharacterized protein n=2 Tax=Malikia spinosa TaxID=86180 RepID=A0A2S9KCT6_9BURK|nr:hypothetical protein [Malikia spinosa]OGB71888.1 MAG: hypothetical protein A2486_05940 [Burkholderiales bacterium RIFOXYC12_FULL_65_23]PRD68258.1 hypothetical protein C6P61_12065 [Malikia spinosa]